MRPRAESSIGDMWCHYGLGGEVFGGGMGKESGGVWLSEWGGFDWVGQSLIGGNCRRGLVMVTTH